VGDECDDDEHAVNGFGAQRQGSRSEKTGIGALPANFNPFDYRRLSNSDERPSFPSSWPVAATGAAAQSREVFDPSRLSLRRMRMQEITIQLLQAAEESAMGARRKPVAVSAIRNDEEKANESAVLRILEKNRDFLLEPLESPGAVVEPDSIYRGIATRSGRYAVYRVEMQERIRRCQNSGARQVLEALRDFVLSHE
jgi:hypothetical protein